MPFKKGQSGNFAGRPKGIVDKRKKLSELLAPHAEDLINKVVELALGGDVCALRLCLERLIPKIKSETISLNLPFKDIESIGGLLSNNTAVMQAVADGELTPEQANVFSNLLEIQHKFIISSSLEDRLAAIEQTLKIRKEIKNETKY